MSRFWKFALLALLALVVVVPVASAQRVIIIHRGFGPGPFWYGPYYPAPYYYTYPRTGEVKLSNAMKSDSVYIDGGLAGQVDKLKHFDLRPGTHDIELRDAEGHTLVREHVNVLAGKTIKIDAGQRG